MSEVGSVAKGATQPLARALAAYVPIRLLTLLEATPAPHPQPPWTEHFEGAVLFVDVSGFTPLAEALSRQGPNGIEQLTQLLNEFFAWLVPTIDGAGGFVARFSGDAVTAVLTGSTPDRAFQQAVYCGLEIMRTVSRQPLLSVDGQDFPLRVKIGLGAGGITTLAVGSQDQELRYFICGPAVQEATLASTFCGPMELLAPEHWRRSLPADVATLEAPGQHLSIIQPFLLRTLAPIPIRRSETLPELPDDVLRRVARFMPEVIHERLRLGLLDLVAEHRPVTVLFAEFSALELDAPDGESQLQTFMASVFEKVARYGGAIDKIEQADKGNLVMALFGAPRAIERADEAAVACAYELMRDSRQHSPHILRIALNAGMVYAGDVGVSWRHEYTVMGDAVNVASRLLSETREGEVLVSARVRARAQAWQYDSPRAVQVKGKTQPIQAWPLLAPPRATLESLHDEPSVTSPAEGLVGRAVELARLGDVVRGLQLGRSAVVFLEGEQGVGKSRLAAHLAEQVQGFGRCVFPRYHPLVEVPFGQWQWPLIELMGGAGPDLDHRVREATLRINPQAEPWLPLLNQPLRTRFPSTPQVEGADLRNRELRLFELVRQLLLDASTRQPLMLVLEDFHEADDASQALLRALVRRPLERPVLLLVLSRLLHTPGGTAELPGVTRIPVLPLERAAADELVRRLATSPPSQALLEALWQRTLGNPLFIEELLHAYEARKVDADGAEAEVSLPDNLRALFQSRIDALPETARAVAKVASVIGLRFKLSTLAATFSDQLPDRRLLREQLERLVSARVLMRVRGESGAEEYEFRHVLSRDVLYGTLMQVQQAELHRRIGTYLEKGLEQGLEQSAAAELAHHFELGREFPRAIRFHLLAATQASDSFANEAAIRGFERALALSDEHWLPLPPDTDRARVMEALGDVYFRVGAYQRAEVLFRKVRGTVSAWLDSVRCLRKEADARLRADDVPNALRCTRDALHLLNARRDWSMWEVAGAVLARWARDALLGPPGRPGKPVPPSEATQFDELDHVYSVLSVTLYYESNPQLTTGIFQMAEVARRIGEPGRIARAYASMALVYASLARFRLSRNYSKAALDWLGKETDDAARVRSRGTVAVALVGASQRIEGRWDEAVVMLEQSVAITQTTGDIWEHGLALINLAILWRLRGNFARARELHARVRALGRQEDGMLYRNEATVCEALVLAELDRPQEALALLDSLEQLSGFNLLLRVRALAHRGWNHFLQGQLQPAVDLLEQAHHIVRERHMLGEHVTELLLWRVEVLACANASIPRLLLAFFEVAPTAVVLPACKGTFAGVSGLVAIRRGRRRFGLWLLERALIEHEKMGRFREAARWALRLARLKPDQAERLRERAATLLEKVGAAADVLELQLARTDLELR